MDVKPWEPVTVRYIEKEQIGNERPIDWGWEKSDWSDFSLDQYTNYWCPALITLANGQRIIVRALSEERKAARKARRTEIMRSVS